MKYMVRFVAHRLIIVNVSLIWKENHTSTCIMPTLATQWVSSVWSAKYAQLRFTTSLPRAMFRLVSTLQSSLLTLMQWAFCVSLRLFASSEWRRNAAFIRLPHPNSMVKWRKFHRTRTPHSIPIALTLWLNSMAFGLWKSTVRLTICIAAQVFCSIMRANVVAKPSLPVR